MKTSEIRKRFTDFFIRYNHEKIPSSSLIPEDDPTLLFANAGMNQFKDIFTGKSNPKNKRATTIQKVVRAGGKHNDLENVGFTARHHTFFEMLGNFSFGDYFKSEAIDFAWKFLTEELKIPKDKLYITVHDSDDEARDLWHKEQGVPLDRIFKKGDKDNFWEMGEFGPCGPCSEIFYDHGEAYTDKSLDPKKINDILDDELRYVEIWNLVFMQYEKTPEGQINLPKPSVDTGAGLERIAALMQGVYWNYDTDAFTPIIKKLEEMSGHKYEGDRVGSFRVIGDHVRSATMLITDGAIPSNEGRGYVLRRIIRRAVRHVRELGLKELTLHQLVPSVFEILGEEYPQNKKEQKLAARYLKDEEAKFLETLDTGMKYLNDALKTEVKDDTFSGAVAFKLYDTYGFPKDLTEVILQEKNLKLDEAAFDIAMEEQKARSKASWKGAVIDDSHKKIFFEIKEKHGANTFLGYEFTEAEGELLFAEKVGDNYAVVFEQTPFYGESGGQAGDHGTIRTDDGDIQVFDSQKPVEDLIVLFVDKLDGLKVGKSYWQKIDTEKRELTKRNHSATHLMQSALIEVLGEHIKQAGSHVDENRLRFDFTHNKGLTEDEYEKVEVIVNKMINDSHEVVPQVMPIEEARNSGAIAMFGEKYGNDVRVVKMGSASTEFCGGTHVDNTKEIGIFKLLSESSLSSGVRRIEALTSKGAIKYLNDRSYNLWEIENAVKTKGQAAVNSVKQLQDQVKNLNKEIKALEQKIESTQSKSLFDNAEKIGNLDIVVTKAPDNANLRSLSDAFVSKYENGVLVLYGQSKGKLGALVRKSKNVQGIHCGNILRESLAAVDGKGGGRDDMAQGSADDFSQAQKFVDKAKEIIKGSV